MTLHRETIEYLADFVMVEIRAATPLSENVAYDLGSRPFVDVLRARITRGDKAQILKLIQAENAWWLRYLGTNLALPILDEEIASCVRANFPVEAHAHTRLAYVYLMLHALRRGIAFGAAEPDAADWVKALERDERELLRCIDRFYSPGTPMGTWDSIGERWSKDEFRGARALYLLAMALVAEDGRGGTAPEELMEIYNSGDPLLSPLALRVQRALAQAQRRAQRRPR